MSREQTATLIIAALGCDFPTAARLAIEMTEGESEAINRSAKNLRHVEQLVARVRDRIGVIDSAIEFAEQATERTEPEVDQEVRQAFEPDGQAGKPDVPDVESPEESN